MSNILDYLDWRGDLTLEAAPFNEVDNLLLAELSFLDLAGIVPDVGGGDSVPLREAVSAYFRRREGQDLSMGVLVPDQIPAMAEKMALSRRFSAMKLDCYRAQLDPERESQFAALTIDLGDGTLYLSFRGTDDTLVGWKEDFNMAFLPIVPSQRLAVDYIREVAARYPRRQLCIGGHSKGGNLTVYGAVFCGEKIQWRIRAIYNNDGPGFKESLVGLPEYQAVRDRMVSIVPQSSIVGMLLEHDDNYTVVKSSSSEIYFQHDGFSWEVLGDHFLHLEEISQGGRIHGQAIRSFIGEMDDAQRSAFVDALFEVLGSTHAKTLSELDADRLGALSAMVRTYKNLRPADRQVLAQAVKVLIRASTEQFMGELETRGQALRKLLIRGGDGGEAAQSDEHEAPNP